MSTKHDDDDRKDLTHIGELPEFLHEEDPELDKFFGNVNHPSDEEEKSELLDLDQLEDELPPEIPVEDSQEVMESIFSDSESPSEIMSESSIEFENIIEDTETNYQDEIIATDSTDTLNDQDQNDLIHDSFDESNQMSDSIHLDTMSFETELEKDFTESSSLDDLAHTSVPEKFEEVKNFAQNFSYGTVEGAGNPPFSIIVKNILFEEDASDIISILKEFGIVDEKNIQDYENSVKIGSLLIPQISEYTAIVLTHKLRRFDIDLEVGLSDVIHPSKHNEANPRGLTKKKNINQNIEETKKLTDLNINQEILVTTGQHLDGFKISKYLGIHNVNTLISEEDLERLQFVDQSLKNNEVNDEDLKIYLGHKESFNELHQELVNELKNKALKANANGIIGLQFHTTHLTELNKRSYQINCSATLVKLEREN